MMVLQCASWSGKQQAEQLVPLRLQTQQLSKAAAIETGARARTIKSSRVRFGISFPLHFFVDTTGNGWG
jgi:hypothetical protein